MGIVIRQSFWGVFFAYLGVAVGFINAVLLMPKFMTQEEIGLWRTLAGMAAFLTPLALMGTPGSIVKFLPGIDENKKSEIIGLLSGWVVIAYFAVLSLYFIFNDTFASFYSDGIGSSKDYTTYIMLLLSSMVVYGFLESISKAHYNISTPNLIREVLYKFLHVIIIILFGLELIDFQIYLLAQLAIYLVLILSILVFIIKSGWLKLKPPTTINLVFKKEIFSYSFFNILNGLGTALFTQMDKLMVSKYLGLKEVAIYTTAIYITSVISIPTRYIGEISTPIISNAFIKKDSEKVKKHYKASSINQLLISSFVFISIFLCSNEIFTIMPNGEKYAGGFYVIFFIGIMKVLNGGFGISATIIGLSTNYKVLTGLIIFFGFLNFVLNIVFIQQFGLIGPALSSLVSYFLFDFTRFLYVKFKFNYQPFTSKFFESILFLAFLTIICFYLQFTIVNPYLSIAVKIISITIIYTSYILLAKPSDEVVNLIEDLKKRVFK